LDPIHQFGHWQFDSWFYPKDGKVSHSGGGGAVTNWTAMPSVFPQGMAYIQSKLGVPMVMHNRQWSDKSDYIKNLPQFEWYTNETKANPGSTCAVPKDPVAFFTWFFQQQQGWGLSMYEQDWMSAEYDQQRTLQQNISMGDLWLKGMAAGAGSPGSNRTIQYCMPYPNDLLSASAYKEVTNARASGDYMHTYQGADQWAIGATSLFYWAIGILPFKDGFYSSTNKQVGGQCVGPEKNPDREAIMATLSCAMVGPMDGINLLNASRTMTTCRKDGTVLKPDKPVSTSDECFGGTIDDPVCLVYHTYSDLKGSSGGRVHYYFNNDATKNALTPAQVYIAPADADKYVVYNWYSGKAAKLNATNTISAGYEGHIYAVVAPVSGEYAFVGEVDKYVTAACIRFTSMSSNASNGLTVQVAGVAGETVKVCAVKVADLSLECNSLTFDTAGTKAAAFPAA
jgi:hypothetical protein